MVLAARLARTGHARIPTEPAADYAEARPVERVKFVVIISAPFVVPMVVARIPMGGPPSTSVAMFPTVARGSAQMRTLGVTVSRVRLTPAVVVAYCCELEAKVLHIRANCLETPDRPVVTSPLTAFQERESPSCTGVIG